MKNIFIDTEKHRYAIWTVDIKEIRSKLMNKSLELMKEWDANCYSEQENS